MHDSKEKSDRELQFFNAFDEANRRLVGVGEVLHVLIQERLKQGPLTEEEAARIEEVASGLIDQGRALSAIIRPEQSKKSDSGRETKSND